jgi:hypothetical protein
MSTGMSFSVSKLPSPTLALTNYAYVNPRHEDLLCFTGSRDKAPYVLIQSTHVYIVELSHDVEVGKIALNAHQRETLGLDENSVVQVSRWVPTAPDLHTILVDFQLLRSHSGEIKESAVIRHLKRYYHWQVFRQSQSFVADFGVGLVKVTARALTAASTDPSQVVANVEQGMVVESTKWVIECTDQLLQFEKDVPML